MVQYLLDGARHQLQTLDDIRLMRALKWRDFALHSLATFSSNAAIGVAALSLLRELVAHRNTRDDVLRDRGLEHMVQGIVALIRDMAHPAYVVHCALELLCQWRDDAELALRFASVRKR